MPQLDLSLTYIVYREKQISAHESYIIKNTLFVNKKRGAPDNKHIKGRLRN